MKITRFKQQGVALITALLILVIATTTASFLIRQLNMSMRRSNNIINSNQAYLYALGAETFAIIGLNEDYKQNKIDSYEDYWAQEIDPYPVEDGSGYLMIKAFDLQARLNINNLVAANGAPDPVSVKRFQRLLDLYDIDIQVSDAVIDWLDPDQNEISSYGAEDNYYLGLDQPYRCANRKLTSISELRQVRGLDTAEQFDELAQHLTALPDRTSINVNLASYEIHYAIIGDAIKAGEALRHSPAMFEREQDRANDPSTEQPLAVAPPTTTRQSTVQRPNIQITADSIVPYSNIDDYILKNTLQDAIKKGTMSKNELAVESSYFLVVGESELDRGRATVKSVLQRQNGGKIHVLLRTLGDL